MAGAPPASRPAILDREADVEIPNRLWSAWAPKGGKRAIVLDVTEQAVAAEQALARAQLHERILARGDDGGNLGVTTRRLVIRHEGRDLPAAVNLQRAPGDRFRWHVEA